MARAKLGADRTLQFWCLGCEEHHGVPVDGSRGWTWNGSLDHPTVAPSILVRFTRVGPDRIPSWKFPGPFPAPEPILDDGVCHSFVTDGKIQYLGDSTHHLAGQTTDLPEVE